MAEGYLLLVESAYFSVDYYKMKIGKLRFPDTQWLS